MKLSTEAITNANATQIVVEGEAAIRGGDFLIDFSAVTRCDTAAVACVLAWMRAAQAAGHKLELRALPRDLVSLAKLYNVDSLIEPA
jgi:phospholipid transport system transporter-binding protein